MTTFRNYRRALLTALAAAVFATLATPMFAEAGGYHATPDIKVFAFIVKKQGLTDDQFHAHWRGQHARLTKQVPQIKRYLQNHGVGSVPTVPGLAPMPYLGIPTVWVENLARLEEMPRDPGYVDVHEDELNLLQRDQLAWLITRETVVADGPAPGDIAAIPTKVIVLLKRRPGVSSDEFQQVLARTAAAARRVRGAGRVTFAQPAAEAYPDEAQPMFDGVIEVSFADDEAYEKAWSRSGKRLLDRLAKVADIEASRGFLAHEERVIWPPFVH